MVCHVVPHTAASMFRALPRTTPRRGRHLPRALRTLAEPRLRSAWNHLGNYTARERREVVHGRWRRACPVQLVSDATDRDRGGFTEPVSFPTDEAAADFVAQESAEEEREAQVPTLEAAQLFFRDLARTADAEVDLESWTQQSSTTAWTAPVKQETSTADANALSSQAARAAEARDVHRHFFADYYTQQGLIDAKDRFQFVDAMLRPAHALFQVNAEKPLQRLVVRHQLEQHHRHACELSNSTHTRAVTGKACRDRTMTVRPVSSTPSGVVFAPTRIHPLIYAVTQMPTQRFGEPDYVPFTPTSSVLACREAAEALSAQTESTAGALSESTMTTTVVDTNEAAAVRARWIDMLCEESDETPGSVCFSLQSNEAARGNEERVSARSSLPGKDSTVSREEDTKNRLHVCGGVACRPPSLHHLHWLQRQLATDSLIHVDALSPLMAMIAARAALSLSSTSSEANGTRHRGNSDKKSQEDDVMTPFPVILDIGGGAALMSRAHASVASAGSDDGTTAAAQEPRGHEETTYYRDVVHYLTTIAAQNEYEEHAHDNNDTDNNSNNHDDDDDESHNTQTSCANDSRVHATHAAATDVTVVVALDPRTSQQRCRDAR